MPKTIRSSKSPWLYYAITGLSAFIVGTSLTLAVSLLVPRGGDRSGAGVAIAAPAGDSAAAVASNDSSGDQRQGEASALRPTPDAAKATVGDHPTRDSAADRPAKTAEAVEHVPSATALANAADRVDKSHARAPAVAASTASNDPPLAGTAESVGAVRAGDSTTASDAPGGDKSPAVDAVRGAAYKRAVAVARAAMANRDVAQAKRNVDLAVKNAQTQQETDEADRLKTLDDHVDQFWKGIRNAVAKLEATDEIELPDKNRVAVIEASRTSLSVMYEGRPREYRIEALPMPLLSSLARTAFRATADSKVVVGSFLAMDREGDRKEARKLWQEAAKAGQTLGKDLLPELDVPLAAGRGKRAR